MPNEDHIDFIHAFNKTILNESQIKELEGYEKQYANKSDQFILREIYRIKPTVSANVINQHIKNLDHLYQMEGFVNQEQKKRIMAVKKILSRPSQRAQSNVEGQFFVGSALLLWFLVLAAIWRRPYYY